MAYALGKYGKKDVYLRCRHEKDVLYFITDTKEVFYNELPIFEWIEKNT